MVFPTSRSSLSLSITRVVPSYAARSAREWRHLHEPRRRPLSLSAQRLTAHIRAHTAPSPLIGLLHVSASPLAVPTLHAHRRAASASLRRARTLSARPPSFLAGVAFRPVANLSLHRMAGALNCPPCPTHRAPRLLHSALRPPSHWVDLTAGADHLTAGADHLTAGADHLTTGGRRSPGAGCAPRRASRSAGGSPPTP